MGRKKKQTDKEYIWCYYCDREFDDENTLVSHQVARHFKCEECGKKLGTFRALMAHSKTNHHLDLQKVPHALPGRDNVATDIHGMSGIPEIAIFEYKVKKAKELGLPIPKRELTVIRNPKQEFAAKLEESRTKSQMAGSLATMNIAPTSSNPFISTIRQPSLNTASPAMPAGPMGPMGAPAPSIPTGYGVQAPAAKPTSTPRMAFSRTDISMEEWKAMQPQYHYQDYVTAASSK